MALSRTGRHSWQTFRRSWAAGCPAWLMWPPCCSHRARHTRHGAGQWYSSLWRHHWCQAPAHSNVHTLQKQHTANVTNVTTLTFDLVCICGCDLSFHVIILCICGCDLSFHVIIILCICGCDLSFHVIILCICGCDLSFHVIILCICGCDLSFHVIIILCICGCDLSFHVIIILCICGCDLSLHVIILCICQ